MDYIVCTYCECSFSESRTYCPHCGRPQLFPNVRCADKEEEREGLKRNYERAKADARTGGVEDGLLSAFEERCAKSVAVFRCEMRKIQSLLEEVTDQYPTFADLAALRLASPGYSANQPDWCTLRYRAEEALFGTFMGRFPHAGKLHYAVLSLDGRGVVTYGDVEVELRESMISHRTHVFYMNSARFVMHSPGEIPCGLRSNWENRALLCVAKLASNLKPGMDMALFPAVLLHSGTSETASDQNSGHDYDDFVECQIFGEITIKSVKKIRIDKRALASGRWDDILRREALKDLIEVHGGPEVWGAE